jgi:CRP-like cAMP-binding protein
MSLNEEVELLRSIPLFANIEPSKLKLLAFTSERLTFQPGQTLMRQGEMGDAGFLIVDGEADVIIETQDGTSLTVAQVGRNVFVGEIGILCDVPRTATIVATTEIDTVRISKDVFMRLVNEFPSMAVEFMRELARRQDRTNKQLTEANRRIRELEAAAQG